MIFPNKSKPHVVRASTVLTTSYVAGNVFSCDEHNTLGILVQFTKGSLTSLEVKVEASIDGGVTYGQQTTETATSGSIAVALAERTFTASGNYWIVINPIKADTIKISVKGTGTVTDSLAAVSAITSWT